MRTKFILLLTFFFCITFFLCLYQSIAQVPPTNDNFTGAIMLTVNDGYNCANNTSGTTLHATKSSEESCTIDMNDDDVWYKFVATKTSHIIKLSNIQAVSGSLNLRYIEVSNSIGSIIPFTRLRCSGYADTEILLPSSIPGDTYFVRIYSYLTDSRISFTVCILTPPDPPANDEYTGATVLPVNNDYNCNLTTSSTTDGATESTQESCETSRNDDDVWFEFVATKALHMIRLSNISNSYGTDNNRYTEVFTSSGGMPDTHIYCSGYTDTETLLSDLTPGDTYFIRIYSFKHSDQTPDRINFDICVLTPPDIPFNDECLSAIDVSNASLITSTTDGAVQSKIHGNCSTGIAYDVWYKVTTISSGMLTAYASSDDFDLVIEVFTGTCEGLTPVICVNNSSSGNESAVINNAVAGQTYYYRIYNHTLVQGLIADATGTFTIQITGPALPVTLTSFTVTAGENNSADLKWATTNETNSSHFDIQHSLNAKDWEKIGEVAAVQESTTLKSYSYTHIKPSSTGINYYRLKSVDTDGTFAYSKIQSLDVENMAKQVVLYPNPVSEKLTINMDNWNEKTQIQLINTLGQKVNAPVNRHEGTVDVRELPVGLYVIRISRGRGVEENYKVLVGIN